MRLDRRPLVTCLLAAAALCAARCTGPQPQLVPLAMGPMDSFTRDVEPVLESRCAQGSCHGRPGRSLALYAPGQHREDATRTYLAEPLSAEEIRVNAVSLAILAEGAPPEQCEALTKPLAIAAGGLWHGGGDVFVDTTDPGYRVMLAWLRACVPPGDGGAP